MILVTFSASISSVNSANCLPFVRNQTALAKMSFSFENTGSRKKASGDQRENQIGNDLSKK